MAHRRRRHVLLACAWRSAFPRAIVSGALIASRLFDVRPWDPALLVRAALLLVLATLVAAFIPARRAAGLDPIRALHIE